jgi:hypothetical protein
MVDAFAAVLDINRVPIQFGRDIVIASTANVGQDHLRSPVHAFRLTGLSGRKASHRFTNPPMTCCAVFVQIVPAHLHFIAGLIE